jgi:hypothetical protein
LKARILCHERLETRKLLAADLITTLDSFVFQLEAVNDELYASTNQSVIRVFDGETVWTARHDPSGPECTVAQPCRTESLVTLKELNGELMIGATVRVRTNVYIEDESILYRFDGSSTQVVTHHATDVEQLDNGSFVYTGPSTDGQDFHPNSLRIIVDDVFLNTPSLDINKVFVGNNSIFAIQSFRSDFVPSTIYYSDGLSAVPTRVATVSNMNQSVLYNDKLFYSTGDAIWMTDGGPPEIVAQTLSGGLSLASGSDGVYFSDGNHLWRTDGDQTSLGSVDGDIVGIHVAADSVYSFTDTDTWVHADEQASHVASYEGPLRSATVVGSDVFYVTRNSLSSALLGNVFDLASDGFLHAARNITEVGADVFFSIGNSIYQVTTPVVVLPGDADADGDVDAADLNIVGLHWQQAANGRAQGDFNDDGRVDDADLNQIAMHWRQNVNPVAADLAMDGKAHHRKSLRIAAQRGSVRSLTRPKIDNFFARGLLEGLTSYEEGSEPALKPRSLRVALRVQ